MFFLLPVTLLPSCRTQNAKKLCRLFFLRRKSLMEVFSFVKFLVVEAHRTFCYWYGPSGQRGLEEAGPTLRWRRTVVRSFLVDYVHRSWNARGIPSPVACCQGWTEQVYRTSSPSNLNPNPGNTWGGTSIFFSFAPAGVLARL